MTDHGNSATGPPAIPGQKPCPMCGASIALASRKCPACGETLAVSPPPTKAPVGCFTIVAVMGIGAVLVALLLPSVHRGREPARRSQCKNNLRQIGIALHNYAERYGALPPAYTVDADGKPLHSWRTLILPFLDQEPLYNSIDLSKPWDDPANAEALGTPVPPYHCPSDTSARNHTTYLASVGPNACLRLTEPRPLSEIKDGTSNTLMVIEVPADLSVPWMSPHDADESLVISLKPESKLHHAGGMHAALCDGSVRFISEKTSDAIRRALITVAGGENVDAF
ncbi:MAG: DUF1559 domain-containing protein [Planctomycetia bacterium]|nr:DUF1559 domain-containing protein [Planctomycetia bacterium]